MYIYALCAPSTGKIRYVGKSHDPIKRLKGHQYDARTGCQLPLHRWLRKLGSEPLIVILEEVDEADVDDAERRHIARLPDLLNLTPGGDGCRKGTKHRDTSKYRERWTPEERRRQSERLKQVYADPAIREQRRVEATTPDAIARSRAAARKRWDAA